MSRRACLIPLVAVACGLVGHGGAVFSAQRALLVGVTEYSNFLENDWLSGPANDVRMMKDILVTRFGFPDDPELIRELVQQGGAEMRPTHANIVREFERLVSKAAAGDRIFILLSGHGTQQPDLNDDDETEDALDEVFLCSDAMRMQAGADQVIPNGISDDTLRGWIKQIRDKGAFVWIIVDSCHSGTAIRGSGAEKLRQIKPDALVPQELLRAAAARATENRERTRGDPAFEIPADPGVVAFYAALPNEPTCEKLLPMNSPDARWHGLLTFTLATILQRSQRAPTYQELMNAVRRQYDRWGRNYPTPLIEGSDLDREVLGVTSWPDRSDITLVQRPGEGWVITAGAVHGITNGTVLQVFPPPEESQTPADTVLCHVRVEQTGFDRAQVTIEHQEGQPAARLSEGCVCRVHFYDFGDMRVPLGVEGSGERADEIRAVLAQLEAEPAANFQRVDDVRQARWLVRCEAESEPMLVPAEGWVEGEEDVKSRQFGPVPEGQQCGPWLGSCLRRLAKAENLLRLASDESDPWESEIRVELELVKVKDRFDDVGQPIAPGRGGVLLTEDEMVGFKVNNHSNCPVDVTLLFLDSNYRIDAVYPRSLEAIDNQLQAKKSKIYYRSRVNANTLGKEHMLLIAVKSGGAPATFIELAQPGIERVKGKLRGGDDGLSRLLRTAAFAEGKTRGLTEDELQTYAVQSVHWTTLPKRAPRSSD